MNPNLDLTLWTGGVFAATMMIALIVLQAIGLWWHARAEPKNLTEVCNTAQKDFAACSATHKSESENHGAKYVLVALSGMTLMFLIVQSSPHAAICVLGVFAVVPYAYLERKRAECKTWRTRSSVARGLDEMQALAASHSASAILEAHPWLERNLQRNTFFQQFDARLTEWIGQGLAQRGNQRDLEKVARELQSEDLVQFLRRAYAGGENGNAHRVFLDAANAVAERIHLDAESFALRVWLQTMWLWFGLIAVLLAAVLLALRGNT